MKLPRKFQLEARNILTRHKSLILQTPLEQSRKAREERSKPTKDGIDYSFLNEHFKL